ncbi:MAG TPA: methylated-DNA--[protein]-cysteine S-methyltransferase [Streptosporangiaceae bacterium]|jgi:methylated-DNA-[protein]-cysteine S-methyltransferase
MTSLRWATVEAPFGPVSVGCSDLGVAETRFGPAPAGAAGHAASATGNAASAAGPADPAGGLLAAARDQVAGYFRGTRRAFDLPLDWGKCSGAQLAVLALLAESVRYGETVSYGDLAGRLAQRDGRPSIGARAIGTIMGSNPIPLIVPCHRVVAADGLGGFSGGCGPELKRWLLAFEGALPAMLDFGAPVLPSG